MSLFKDMMGHKMTAEKKRLLAQLRRRVADKQLTVRQAKDIWNRRVLAPAGEGLI